MIPVFKYLGSKGKLAPEIVRRILHNTPSLDTFYEGFAGSAAVTLELRSICPNVKVKLTDLNSKVINGLKYIRDNGDPKPVLKMINKIVTADDRYEAIKWYIQSEDPVEWLAAANTTRPTKNNYPMLVEDMFARAKWIPRAFEEAKEALAGAEIIHGPYSPAHADAVFLDPPYEGKTFKYDGEEFEVDEFVKQVSTQTKMCDFCIVTDYGRSYPGFSKAIVQRRVTGGVNNSSERDNEWIYEWKRSHEGGLS